MSHWPNVPTSLTRKSTRRPDSQPEGPTTTLSGIAPGRALYDPPSPQTQPPELERHQRSRKATTRKLEWIESLNTQKNPKPRRPATSGSARKRRTVQSPDPTDDEDGGTLARKTRNAGPSETPADPGPPVSDTQMATVGTPNPVQFFSKEGVLFTLQQNLGHDVTHLSTRDLAELANSIAETQAAALELKKWDSPAILQPATSMGVGGGYYRNRTGDVVAPKPSSQSSNAVTNPSPLPGKRPSSPSSNPPPKRSRLNNGDDDEDEDEDYDDSDDDGNGGGGGGGVTRRGGGGRGGDDDDDGDSEEEDELEDDEKKSQGHSHARPPPLPDSDNPQRSNDKRASRPPPFPSQGSRTADLSPPANGPPPRDVRAASQANLAHLPNTRVDDPAEDSATVSETETETETESEQNSVTFEPSEPAPTRTPTVKVEPHPQVRLSTPHDKDIARSSAWTPGRSLNTVGLMPSPIHFDVGPLSASQADSWHVSGLPSSLCQSDMTAILQWALKVAEERVREQQALAKSSIKEVLRSRLRQDPQAGDGESSRGHTTRSAGPKSSAVRAQTVSDDDVIDIVAGSPGVTVTAKGNPQRRKKKPGLADFSRTCQQLAKAITPLVLVKSIITDSYASVDQYCEWVEDEFRKAWFRELPGIPLELPDREFFKVVSRRSGLTRTNMSVAMRPIMETQYGFVKLVKSGEQAQENRRLNKRLLPINFYCKDTKTGDDPYEHPAISHAITVAYFSDTKAFGVKFRKEFNPIPLPAVALVLTLMQFCISEWASGRHEKLVLDCEAQRPVFDTHLKGLKKYAKLVPDRMDRFQKTWFQNGMDSVAGSCKDQPGWSQPIFRADRVRPPTPPPNRAGNGQSKGKGKA